jgi:O-antigen biosynthesis protein
MPPMMCSVNIILPTIRFLPVAQDIMMHLFRTGETNPHVHVTIADGQEDKEKKAWIFGMADRLLKAGRFTYIGMKDPTERVSRAAQLETEWILLLSDDDPYSVNYVRCLCDAAQDATAETTAIVPYAYLCYSPTHTYLHRLQPINEPDQLGRLKSLFTQGQNGLLTWGIMRRRLFLDWMGFVKTKPIWPSYSDQLLVSYLAMKGRLEPTGEECTYLKDEGDWHDPQRAIVKDARSYPENFLALLHEVFWTADLFTFLRAQGLEAPAVPAVMARVETLLRNGVGSIQPRLQVLNIEDNVCTQEAVRCVRELAAQASIVLRKSVQEQIQFFEYVQAMSWTLAFGAGGRSHRQTTEESSDRAGSAIGTEGACKNDEQVPAVSVIIPCYGQAHFLSEAVESVVAQTYGEWECLIVNDGSPDDTSDVARRLIAQYPHRSIRLIEKRNGGLGDARNAGIRSAQGRYILPLDADDRLHPDYLTETVDILDRRPDIAIVYVDEQNFGETTHTHRKGVVSLSNLLHGNVHDYCSLYRRTVWETVKGYSPAMYIGAEDWNFWLAAAKSGFQSYHLEKPLFLYRNRAGTMVAQVHANLTVVKAHVVLHHPDLFHAAGQAAAREILSQLTAENRQKLERACAAHPDNPLLKLFQQLAQAPSEFAMPEKVEQQHIPMDTHAGGPAAIDGGAGSRPMRDERGGTPLPETNPSEPTSDEAARWSKIAAYLEYALRRVRHTDPDRPLRMIDVGCGRGWLTNLAATYGCCEGIDPAVDEVTHARRLFPHLRFETGTAGSLLRRPDFAPYDVVLCAGGLDQVPHEQKQAFIAEMASLLKPDGVLILTTPRGEIGEQWKAIAPQNPPVENWVTEEELRGIFSAEGLCELGQERVHVETSTLRFIPAPTPSELQTHTLLPVYQVWACQRTGVASVATFTRRPMVSVIVPTHNRPDRLREALASIQAQTYQDFEIIIVNDGAVDVAPVIAGLNNGGRITCITHDRNRGLAAARNTGIRVAKGKYIAYLDDDDRYLPNHLETLVAFLESSECKAAYTDAWRIYEKNDNGRYVEAGRDLPYSYDFSPGDLLVSNYFPVLCVMHERACIDEVGGFDESLFAHEDWDLWIRMATRYPFTHLKQITAEFTWRMDGSSMTSGSRDTYARTTQIIYRKYRPYAERVCGALEAQQEKLARLRESDVPPTFDCSIIIPVWNRLELTKQCLIALAEVTTGLSFEVLVVDNGSVDGTEEFLSQLQGDVRIIRNRDNLGFAKACNQGAQAARGKYLVFLNNDTLPKEGWLRALVHEVEEHPEVGIVGSKLLYPDGTIQHGGVVRDCRYFLPYHLYKSFAGDHPAVNQRREFQIVTAACLLIRRSLFEEAGGFDEGYVNGFEDADLCLKVRERGHLVVYQPRSVVVHLESQTPGRKSNEDANAARFLGRWGTQWWAADEDRHFQADGYKLKRLFRNGQLGGDIQLVDGIKDGASWAHVAATQAAALKKDWTGVRRELALVDDWPRDPFVLSWAAMVCEKLEEPAFQRSFLARYLELTDAPDERLALVRMLLADKDLPGADQHLKKLLSSSPDHAEGLLLRGVLCMQREQYRDAEAAFSSALRQGADRKKCLMGMGMASMGQAYTQGAWERFLQVLGEHPDDPEAIHWLIRAGTAQNRWDQLSRQLREYLLRNPGDLSARFALASVLVRADRVEAARREHDALYALAPNYDGLAELGQAIANKETLVAMEAAQR